MRYKSGVGVVAFEDTTMSPVLMLLHDSNDEPWSVKHAEKQSTIASTEIHDSAIATTYETLSEAVRRINAAQAIVYGGIVRVGVVVVWVVWKGKYN